MRTAFLVLALLAVAAFAFLWFLPPPAPRRSSRERTRLDDVVPEFQFSEFHERFVRATPEAVDRAIRSVPANEILLFRAFTLLRNPGRLLGGQKEGILNPPDDRPVLDVALASGFVLLADEPGKEVVLGTLVLHPRGPRVDVPSDRAGIARRFAALAAPGYAKAAMNFRIRPVDGGCRLTTETRVFATDPRTARTFARYWRLIRAGSGILRRTWLRAIAARAEARSGADSRAR